MAHLKLTGVSDDGKRLLLMSDRGVEFTLDITPALRAALDGDTSGIRPVENQMESVLRPRDIQARVRAGQSPEEVAQAAQTSVEKILIYARPVLAEREHVAQSAQKASLRRTGGARTLGEAVTTHLFELNLPPESVEWDSWRREDGRWSLIGRYAFDQREGSAEFTFDQPGSFVLLDNDDARWLIGEDVEAAATPAAPEEPEGEPRRRLSAVPNAPAADVHDTDHEELPFDYESEQPTYTLDDIPGDDPAADETAAAVEQTAEVEAVRSADDVEPEPTPPPRRAVQKKRGRASVPSWDEIMFGGSDQ